LQNYIDSKFRITQNQTAADFFIYGADDPIIQKELKKRVIPAIGLPFGLGEAPQNGAGVSGDHIVINWKQNTFTMSIFDFSLQGKHNTYNSMAASTCRTVLNIRDEKDQGKSVRLLSVRTQLEYFLKVHGIEFVNDSKATNFNSTSRYALECIQQTVVWNCRRPWYMGYMTTMINGSGEEKGESDRMPGHVDNLKIIESF
jgi:UDP-N-acetylmuramoylalanine--D-glutamate ligase